MKWMTKQVQRMKQGTQSRGSGTTQRAGMGRRLRMGGIRTPAIDSCQCMTETSQYWKVISLKLK